MAEITQASGSYVYTSLFKPPALSAVEIILVPRPLAGVYNPECGVESRGYQEWICGVTMVWQKEWGICRNTPKCHPDSAEVDFRHQRSRTACTWKSHEML